MTSSSMLVTNLPVKINGADWGIPKVNIKHPLAPNAWTFDNGRQLSYFDILNHWECNKMESVFTVEQGGLKIFDRKI